MRTLLPDNISTLLRRKEFSGRRPVSYDKEGNDTDYTGNDTLDNLV